MLARKPRHRSWRGAAPGPALSKSVLSDGTALRVPKAQCLHSGPCSELCLGYALRQGWQSPCLPEAEIPLSHVPRGAHPTLCLSAASGDDPGPDWRHNGDPHLLHLPGPDLQEGPQEHLPLPGERCSASSATVVVWGLAGRRCVV